MVGGFIDSISHRNPRSYQDLNENHWEREVALRQHFSVKITLTAAEEIKQPFPVRIKLAWTYQYVTGTIGAPLFGFFPTFARVGTVTVTDSKWFELHQAERRDRTK